MPKRSAAVALLPAEAAAHLRLLGENLSIARKRRRETLAAWASRIGVSEPTLSRMERGDPTVSMAVYATALWMMGRSRALADAADPQQDLGALETDVRAALARSVRPRRNARSTSRISPGPKLGAP
ncbi:helix-turn-helix transcriptional regulator [Roseateles sp. SL47]|jgi:transcriptional regulator with XRE-family HTH domain|uniref:helix-turn-helix domain-containing protein n=1 Tax=Roseateles sp. SL47 TaxID=2995138 RepID=UPI00226E0E00|nr:helix-turn-helix transcriptional regulator [Roseateles sp. SL47]WAC75408.1 helix-turn-helix transcriptional regulator [Roseateles sp. SL47]